jgi:hypothetical protein
MQSVGQGSLNYFELRANKLNCILLHKNIWNKWQLIYKKIRRINIGTNHYWSFRRRTAGTGWGSLGDFTQVSAAGGGIRGDGIRTNSLRRPAAIKGKKMKHVLNYIEGAKGTVKLNENRAITDLKGAVQKKHAKRNGG